MPHGVSVDSPPLSRRRNPGFMGGRMTSLFALHAVSGVSALIAGARDVAPKTTKKVTKTV